MVAMQFAGGMSIARLACEWEREPAWVEDAIRLALLENIPRRDGGLKVSRTQMRAARSGEREAASGLQGELELEP